MLTIGFYPSSRVKIKARKDRKILGSYQRTEKTAEHEGDGDTNYRWSTWNGPQELGKETRGIENQRKNQYHLDHSIV